MLLRANGRLALAAPDKHLFPCLMKGNPKSLRWLGDVDEAKITFKTTKVERKESWSGERGKSMSLVLDKEANLDLTLMDFSPENVSQVIYGKNSLIANGTVTGEVLPSGLLSGDRIALK